VPLELGDDLIRVHIASDHDQRIARLVVRAVECGEIIA
jgi:hypothetical protein